jgi:hypothetical protein
MEVCMEFLKTQGKIIVTESGKEIILKGFGMGNWMNQEGFLFGSSVFSTVFGDFVRAEKMDRGRSINQTIIELCGRDYADEFWRTWYRNYFSEADIKDLAKRGMNSVRLPLNAKVFLKESVGINFDEEMFELLDNVVDWCEENGLYVILDMHAAAAGQSGLLCDDGVDNIPHLYIDEEGWERTLVLWEKLATRYADRSVIAGYDVLNEPLALGIWDKYIPELKRFYAQAIERIRKVDTKHILFLEGHRFASRNDIFHKDMDPVGNNWALAMHMYESLPDLGILGPILASSDELGVPVWMGETGGSSEWMTTLYEMLHENHIGVNIWCHKAVDDADAATLCTFKAPDGFEQVRNYAHQGGAKPGYEKSIRIFNQLLENVKFENCEIHADRVDAILRRPTVTVPAIGYDMLPGEGVSFKGSYPYCVFCGYRREDHMHIVNEEGFTPFESVHFSFASVGRPPKYGDWTHLELMLEENDFACYSIRQVDRETEIIIDYHSQDGGKLEITSRNNVDELTIPATSKLTQIKVGTVSIGDDTSVKIRCVSGKVILRTVQFRA